MFGDSLSFVNTIGLTRANRQIDLKFERTMFELDHMFELLIPARVRFEFELHIARLYYVEPKYYEFFPFLISSPPS